MINRKWTRAIIVSVVLASAVGWLLYDHVTTLNDVNESYRRLSLVAGAEARILSKIGNATSFSNVEAKRGDSEESFLVTGLISLDHGARVVSFTFVFEGEERVAEYIDGTKVDLSGNDYPPGIEKRHR